MSVENISMGIAQYRLQQEAAVKVQSMAMQSVEEQAAGLMKLLDSVRVITDPNMGNYVDMLA